MRSLRVVRWIRRTPRRFSSPATLALTVVLGMPRRRAAAEKLPASTTFTKTAMASRGHIVRETCTVIAHFAVYWKVGRSPRCGRMPELTEEKLTMKSRAVLTIAAAAAGLAIMIGAAGYAQDKYALKVPGGLAFAEFKGYEDWAVVAIDHTEDLMKAI